MRLLLDTHALIWWWMDDPILSVDMRAIMSDPANTVFVSAASGWEIATKVRKGQLRDLRDHVGSFDDYVGQEGFRHLPITLRHGVHGGSLAGSHKDPFDRILAAQALLEDMTVITCDREIADFGCKVLW